MAEQQALDRIHRMGQDKDVITTRYIVKNSIEEVCIIFCGILFAKLIQRKTSPSRNAKS